MARALISTISKTTDGDDLVLTWMVEFFGRDLSQSDMTVCTATIPGTATVTQIRALIRAAIQAEATRIGHTWDGRANRLDDLFVGL